MSEIPYRAVELSLKIGGNTEQDVMDALEQIVLEFSTRGIRAMASGAPSQGWHSEVIRRPNMTPEKYQESLRKYRGRG